jgi:predicted dehydrogenase
MNAKLKNKLTKLPISPGVYFHKDKTGQVIYIGKAANLRNRVRQYFQVSRVRDPKTIALITEIDDVDWMEVETELDALFLEAELIRRNLPKFNILLRDDKSYSYIRISYSSEHPAVTLTRRPIDDKAKYFGAKFAIPFYVDMHEMLKNELIDVIVILTESGKHAKVTIEMAKYGKHIVVEKPMALTLNDADKMIAACDASCVKLFVVKQNRFNIPIKKLREALELGRFGKMVIGTIRVRWCRDQKYYDQDAWRGTWAYDGGVLTNQASHHIDLLEWMMGDVESVFALSSTALVDIEAEDTAVVVLRFSSGALGIIEATTATRPVDLEGSISVVGEGGVVEVGGFAVNKLKIWNFVKPEQSDEDVPKSFSENPPNVYGFGHKAYYEHIVDSINNGSPQMVDGLAGRKSLELISAIYESIETQKMVFLRFKPYKSKLGLEAI